MSMFSKAKTIAPAPKAKLEKKKQTVEIAGIEHLAMIDALQKTLEALRTTLEFEVKAVASERFTSYVAATGQKPENFTATEGGATASRALLASVPRDVVDDVGRPGVVRHLDRYWLPVRSDPVDPLRARRSQHRSRGRRRGDR